MFGIQEDGTYTLTAEGVVRSVADDITEGFVVALGKLENAADVLSDTLFGRWTDTDGTVYWDKVVVLSKLDEAKTVARMLRELAIWDLGAGKEIRIEA